VQITSPGVPTPYNIRERAEVARSDVEAATAAAQTAKVGRRRIRRYSNPSADTNYPLEYAFHLVGDVRNRTVVDLGCGAGVNSVLLAARGAHVLGLDISLSLLELGKRRTPSPGVTPPELLAASAHQLPLASESIDLVFGIAVLHHLDLAVVSREVHRVLRRGGRAIFQEPVRNSKLIERLRTVVPYRADDVSPYEHPLTDAELADFAQPFAIRRQRAFSLPHVNLSQIIPLIRNHPHKLHVLDGALLRRFSALERFAGIRVIELENE
jgi:SAM-dependent methyltransferase